MKLSEWAARQGVHYQTAWRWWKQGILPVPARQLSTGTILVEVPGSPVGAGGRTVVYARVSSHDQRADLDRQVSRVMAWTTAQRLPVEEVVTEVGSGLNGRRPKLQRLLGDPQVTVLVVEHRDRLARFGVEQLQRRLDQRAAGEDVQVPWTLAALRREWNRAKHQAAPWWADNSKECYSSGLDALARGLKNFTDAKQGHRGGARMGFPRRKRKGRSRDACRFTTGAIRVEPDRHHVVLPRLGRLRTHESTRKLARRVEQGTARILSATISRQGGRWYVSYCCQVQRAVRAPRQPGARVGVDVGLRQLAVLSDGRQVPNPAPLQAALGKLRQLNRQLARRHGPVAPTAAGGSRPTAGWIPSSGPGGGM